MGWGWAEKKGAGKDILGSGQIESNFSMNNQARVIRQKGGEQRVEGHRENGLERPELAEEHRFHRRHMHVDTFHTRGVASSASGWFRMYGATIRPLGETVSSFWLAWAV